ncbi:ABC transmembrane type-1 domain-containing protein [Babesia gibsoni]|uniref:ABC transmembrane type-1 domain-containing protein n=1 Tax=Babesia gibsoni TaxID=33632 RepID=A0AAD8LK25_BABGI|nr:ABC transmembrane type-1 domain-containing protein [Babesia gibsoni]
MEEINGIMDNDGCHVSFTEDVKDGEGLCASDGNVYSEERPSISVDMSKKIKMAPNLKDLMMHKTILFMDYRRLRRRFNGIRQPMSYNKALFISLFCVCLAIVPFVYFKEEESHYVIGVEIGRGVIPYASSIFFVFGSFLLAWMQLSTPFKWPVAISYAFMFATLIVMIVLKHVIDLGEFVWISLTSYAVIQIIVLVMTRIVIWLGPLLALNGLFFPCTEHFHLLERIRKGTSLNITISRYNDYSVICGANAFGICTCIYRVSYRGFRWLIKRIFNKGAMKKGDTPFSHQMRYRGEVDEDELPHGYGEWLEDDSYGERLQGYWWHGYPIGPFSSQEIGSGSMLANTRVAFITDTKRTNGKVRYGVSSTECSISGNFFREFPLTYFFNPLYNDKRDCNPGGFYKRCKFFNVLHDQYSGLKGASFKWCVRMLRSQFFLNMPSNTSTITVYIDRLSKSLRLDGYKKVGEKIKEEGSDEITIKVVTRKGSCMRGLLCDEATNNGDINHICGKTCSTINSNDGENKVEHITEDNGLRLNMSSTKIKMSHSRSILNVPPPAHGKDGISHLFLDEDAWEDQVNAAAPQIAVKGWAPISSFGKMGCIADQAVIYIHGYNVTLREACSQMAHIVAFSKLPPYVLPFVFNWDGQYWGPFGAFAYLKAKVVTQHPGLEESFCDLLTELRAMEIKHLHVIVHSCGARVFFKVFNAAIHKGLIQPVVGNDPQYIYGNDVTVDYEGKRNSSSSLIRMDTLMLLNPDFPMKQFRDHEYFVVRSYCDHIVMYADTRDHCLTISELFNREISLGMSVFGMCTTPEILEEAVFGLEEAGIFSQFNKAQNVAEIPYVSSYTIYKGSPPLSRRGETVGGIYSVEITSTENVMQLVKREVEHNSVMLPTQNNVIYNMSHKDSGEVSPCDNTRLSEDLGLENRPLWLDMDVIDTTMIDTNVDFLKHSLYQMKREIMDDLREVILMKIRADQRHTRLDRRRGNVFVFRVAPAAVNHLFRGP